MRGGRVTLGRTQRLYVEFAPEQLQEQGSTTEEFVAIVEEFFKSAYVIDGSMRFIRAAEFSDYLIQSSRRRGFLINLLFTQDTEAAIAAGS